MVVSDVIQVIIHYLAEEKTPINKFTQVDAKYKNQVFKVMELLKNFDERKLNIATALTNKKGNIYSALAKSVFEKSNVRLLEKDNIIKPSRDILLSGNGDTTVKGIFICYTPTINSLKEALAKDCNLIITHEPVFYNAEVIHEDEVFLQKQKLIDDNNLIIWRFCDLAHLFSPDIIVTGLLKALNLFDYADFNSSDNVIINQTISKREIYYLLKQNLNANTMKVVGDLEGSVESFGILIGNKLGIKQIPHMSRYNLPLLICGEINEWEISEYVRDANELGLDKTLIVLGNKESEAVGMEYFSKWLKKYINNVPIEYFDCASPFNGNLEI